MTEEIISCSIAKDVAELGSKLVTHGSAVRCNTNCTMEPGHRQNNDRLSPKVTAAQTESDLAEINLMICYNIQGFVCVAVLRPSQPNGVISSAVSLPNHMFTGQA